ncbi:unnamed protein product [Gadus morhua 'NCC']
MLCLGPKEISQVTLYFLFPTPLQDPSPADPGGRGPGPHVNQGGVWCNITITIITNTSTTLSTYTTTTSPTNTTSNPTRTRSGLSEHHHHCYLRHLHQPLHLHHYKPVPPWVEQVKTAPPSAGLRWSHRAQATET